jgi:hypothetical protein
LERPVILSSEVLDISIHRPNHHLKKFLHYSLLKLPVAVVAMVAMSVAEMYVAVVPAKSHLTLILA